MKRSSRHLNKRCCRGHAIVDYLVAVTAVIILFSLSGAWSDIATAFQDGTQNSINTSAQNNNGTSLDPNDAQEYYFR